MLKSKKYSLIALILVLFSSVIAMFVINNSMANASTNTIFENAFESQMITFDSNVRSKDGRFGLVMKSSQENSHAKLSNMICADFNLSFSLYNEKEVTSLGEFEIRFFDKNGKGFSILINNYDEFLSVCVEFSGKRHGITYLDGKPDGDTKLNNDNGIYTHINKDERYSLIYEKESGNVYVGNSSEKLLIWCLNEKINDGYESGVFIFENTYFADFVLSKINYSKESTSKDKVGVMIFSINGQSFAGSFLSNSKGPDVYAELKTYAVVGVKYFLQEPLAIDVIDGQIDEIYVEVNNGKEAIISNTLYSDSLYFMPESENVYSIKYSAKDKDGKVGGFSKEIQTLNSVSNEKFVFSHDFSSNEFGVGSKVFLPNVYLRSDFFIDNVNYDIVLDVTLDGKSIVKYDSVEDFANKEFTFESEGTYEFAFCYVSNNYNYCEKSTFVISIDKPLFCLESPILCEYFSDERVNFPNASVTFNGESVIAEKIVRFPNGAKYKIGSNVMFDNEGYYEIEYSAIFNDKNYSFSIPFKVFENRIGYSNNLRHYEVNIDGKDVPVVSFKTSEQEVYTNEIVDLYEFSNNEPFVEIEYMPSNGTTPDCKYVYVTLQDIYNPDIYAKIRLVSAEEDVDVYKIYSGIKTNVSDSFIGVRSDFGTESELVSKTIWGARTLVDPLSSGATIKLYYDVYTNTVYINRTSSELPSIPIVDLDSLRYYDEVWSGFTSGKVKVSVCVGDIVASRVNMMIHKIGNSSLNKEVEIKLSDYDGNYPLALVGQPYKIFNAVAMSKNGVELPMEISVVFADNQGACVPSNGIYFTPPVEGSYCIVYKVKDLVGNDCFEKKVYINAVDSLTDISIDVDLPNEIYIGTVLDTSNYTLNNLNGKAEVKTFIEFNGQKTEIDQFFIPSASGNYKLLYEITDYCRKVTKCIDFVCEDNEKPIFNSSKIGIDFMVSGRTYTLPVITAYDSGFGENIQTNISVIVDGVETPISNIYTPDFSENKNITIRYTAVGENSSSVQDFNLKVLCVKSGSKYIVSNLFVTDNVSINHSSDGVTLTTSVDGKVRYFSELAKNFSLSFKVNSNNFSRFNIYLTDCNDLTNIVKVSYEKNGDNVNVRINDTDRVYYNIGGAFGDNTIYDISYDDNSGIISNNASKFVHTTRLNLFGEKFSGFTGTSVYLDLELEGVEAESTITVVYLNNQSFKNQIDSEGLIKDLFKPEISLLADYGGKFDFGTEYSVPMATAYDVLSGKTDCVVSCYDPSGNYVLDNLGREINGLDANEIYKFVFEAYGSYTIEYYAVDQNKQRQYFSFIVKIVDVIAPEITINGDIVSTMKLGGKFVIPGVTVKDNISNKNKISVYVKVVYGDSLIKSFKAGDTLTFAKKGEYVLSYLAYDEANNVAIKTFRIIVK